MDLSLLHVGLMKTATSYMQTMWLRQPEIALAYRGTFPLMNAIRQAVQTGQFDPKAKTDIEFDLPLQANQRAVISNEGFSTAFLNAAPSIQCKTGAFIDLSASMLGDMLPSLENTLIVVREPVSWIRSIHAQSAKEGGSQNASEFVESQIEFLTASLDLRLIFESYKRHFPNTRLLPYELLKTDEAQFWRCIESWFEIPAPKIGADRSNESPSKMDTRLLASLNQLGGSLLSGLLQSSTYPHANEKKSLTESYGASSKWVHRRFVEYANQAEKDAVAAQLGLSESDQRFFEFALPSRLREKIETDFLGFLDEGALIETEQLDSYKTAFASAK